MVTRDDIRRGVRYSALQETVQPFRRRFALAFVYYTSVVVAGAAGYSLIEGWSFFDSLYMSAITVSSVGFAEIHPLSDAGRTFTMIFLGFGLVGLGVWWALFAAFVVETDLRGTLKEKRRMKSIEGMRDHYVVCGLGRVGRVVLDELLAAGRPVIAIDRDSERLAAATAGRDVLFLEGNATHEAVLQTAQIGEARGLAACLSTDADNVFLCLTARGLVPDLEIVARAVQIESVEKLTRAGANQVVCPHETGGHRLAAMLTDPVVSSFLDAALVGSDISMRAESVRLAEGSALVGRTLAEAAIPNETGAIVLQVRRPGDVHGKITTPRADTTLAAGDVLIALGTHEQIDELRALGGA